MKGGAIRLLGQSRLIFPDFTGNGLYNILENPHTGMLFIDCPRLRGTWVNGISPFIFYFMEADDGIRKI
ncbi:MAG: hypothetical protein FWD68_03520 [Alphaproteobacteria bacterium]|nr:hypothetical protein [Alphaproteobacteria bacterium]